MRGRKSTSGLLTGACLGIMGVYAFAAPIRPGSIQDRTTVQSVEAASNDRYGDYVMCTGAVGLNLRTPIEGVWMLDYRAGKLLSTVVDRNNGKVTGWAELDLVVDFGIPPKTDCHFMMTTGTITNGQSALYIAEIATGKFGVYTLAPVAGAGYQIRRHDMVAFRADPKNPLPAAPVAPQAILPLPGDPMPGKGFPERPQLPLQPK